MTTTTNSPTTTPTQSPRTLVETSTSTQSTSNPSSQLQTNESATLLTPFEQGQQQIRDQNSARKYSMPKFAMEDAGVGAEVGGAKFNPPTMAARVKKSASEKNAELRENRFLKFLIPVTLVLAIALLAVGLVVRSTEKFCKNSFGVLTGKTKYGPFNFGNRHIITRIIAAPFCALLIELPRFAINLITIGLTPLMQEDSSGSFDLGAEIRDFKREHTFLAKFFPKSLSFR